MTQSTSQLCGFIAGVAAAPAVALGSRLRDARFFHPNGVLVRGEAHTISGAAAEGAWLAGPVFARFSSAWWKTREWPDVLGCALRFSHGASLKPEAEADDQDLLLATVRHPLTTLLAPLTTHIDDFLGNHYFGVSPFRFAGLGRVKLRLVPSRKAEHSGSRTERLLRALPIGLTLEARLDRFGARYQPLVAIELHEHMPVAMPQLHFDPFATGRGLVPVGFVHAMRLAVYEASRRGRHVVTPPDRLSVRPDLDSARRMDR